MIDQTATATLPTPAGLIRVTAGTATLLSIRIAAEPGSGPPDAPAHPLLAEALAQISAWFDGRLRSFDLPLAPAGSTQGEQLRAGIAAVPYGETRSYGAVATTIGSAARAVGQACRTNPFPLVIPCHRIVSAGPRAFYSAGGGPRTKSWLLDFEQAMLAPTERTRLL